MLPLTWAPKDATEELHNCLTVKNAPNPQIQIIIHLLVKGRSVHRMCGVFVCRTLVGGKLGFHWYSFSVAICLHTPAHHHHGHSLLLLSIMKDLWEIDFFFLLTCLTKSCNREGVASLSDRWILGTNQHTRTKYVVLLLESSSNNDSLSLLLKACLS